MNSGGEVLARALRLPNGERPFPWQLELLDRLQSGTQVEALDIPTGLGKTATMAIWLVARAVGAKVPRRLVYVVDRRAVVDQATRVAEELREWVQVEPGIAAKLGLGDRPLPISTLRGQHVDNREWLEDPSLPAIVVGTVDMIGSRLLFSGYGVSSKMRPYHAGMLGADSLVVLDEAHLVQPFERLLEQVASGADTNGRTLGPPHEAVPPLRFMSLSATGRERSGAGVLRLGDADRSHPIVKRRLEAKKSLVLRDEVQSKELPERLAAEAWTLSGDGAAATRIIVFCTSRDDAMSVQESLRKRSDAIDVELFVGGRRIFEREMASNWLSQRGFLAGTKGAPDRATFVIATAAGEVGVDLDADHAVCDLVAWERMVQRFGRVNRRGDGDATIIIVPASVDDEDEAARRTASLELLQQAKGDVSPAALTALRESAELVARASTPPPLHPPLTRALVEAWSMTSLEEHTGRPEVAPWIRGWEVNQEPQTTVVWRSELPVDDEGRLLPKRELETFREAASPHLAERLETETWRVVDWLAARIVALSKPASDRVSFGVVGVVLDPAFGAERIVRATDDLSSADKTREFVRLLNGATLLVDRRVGGLSGGLLNDGEDSPSIEVTGLPFRVQRTKAGPAPLDEGWRTEATFVVARTGEDEAAWLVVQSAIKESAGSEEGRSAARNAQLLDEHEEWAEAEAKRLGRTLQLSPELTELLAVAARLHDEGKKAERWQRAFHAPNGGQPPYAKTVGRPDIKLLEGYRHELGSLPHAEQHPRVRALSPELRELTLHMIAAHHGGARPILRTTGAPEPPTRLVARAREIALRFSALEKRWGPWGLAWWEALLRAADQRASRRNDLEGGSRG